MQITIDDKSFSLLQNEDGKYGIEVIKFISLEIIKVAEKYQERAKGGFNWWERLWTGMDISKLGGDLVQQLDALFSEFKDLSKNEALEVVKAIMEATGLAKANATKIFNDIVIPSINLAFSAVELGKNVAALIGEK